jgi:hypothetical protein
MNTIIQSKAMNFRPSVTALVLFLAGLSSVLLIGLSTPAVADNPKPRAGQQYRASASRVPEQIDRDHRTKPVVIRDHQNGTVTRD